jgi:hypothetical protein
MTSEPSPKERLKQLLIELIDGQPDQEQLDALQHLMSSDPSSVEQVVDHLLLDSLLKQEIGADAVGSLVDIVTESGAMPVVPAIAPASTRVEASNSSRPTAKTRGGWHRRVAWMSIVSALIVAAFLVGRHESTAVASPAALIREAAETHATSIERVYLVNVDRATASAEVEPPREVRVMTLGDRFYVEMNRGERRFHWGRNDENGVWICLGSKQAVIIEHDEMGAPLEYLANLYSLNLRSLLDNFVRNCLLTRERQSGTTHVIRVTPRRGWRGGWLRSARIEIDRETKVVRRLTIERDIPQQGPSTITFILIDSRPADEALYQPEGHLTEPFHLLTRDVQPDKRREILRNWFSPLSERWIKTSEPNRN